MERQFSEADNNNSDNIPDENINNIIKYEETSDYDNVKQELEELKKFIFECVKTNSEREKKLFEYSEILRQVEKENEELKKSMEKINREKDDMGKKNERLQQKVKKMKEDMKGDKQMDKEKGSAKINSGKSRRNGKGENNVSNNINNGFNNISQILNEIFKSREQKGSNIICINLPDNYCKNDGENEKNGKNIKVSKMIQEDEEEPLLNKSNTQYLIHNIILLILLY